MRGKWRAQRADRGAHAARGFVGGAARSQCSSSVSAICFNAARGYSLSPLPPLRGPPPPLTQGRLCYAPFSRRITQYQLPPPVRGSGQRLPITLRFTRVLGTFSHTTRFPFSCALWACFSDRSVSGERSEPIGAPMPHAALWVVQHGM